MQNKETNEKEKRSKMIEEVHYLWKEDVGMCEFDNIWEFTMASRIKFGIGVSKEVGFEARKIGGRKVILITDKVITKLGLANTVINSLADAGFEISVYDQVDPDPTTETYNKCIDFAKQDTYDMVIGLGGGSSIDVAKIIGIILKHGGTLMDYIDSPIGKGKAIPEAGNPVIAIPTTAGTGSETTRIASVSITQNNLKVSISSTYLYPNLAIVDPLMSLTLPPEMTALSGMDALCHAIEAYVTPAYDQKLKSEDPKKRPAYGGATPVTEMFAAKAINLISKHLRRAYNNGHDIEARTGMALASLLAGISFTNAGLGAVHAMCCPLGARLHIPHALSVAVLLPAVMDYNVSSNFKKFAHIAMLMGENTNGLSRKEIALKAGKAVRELAQDLKIPEKVGKFDITDEEISEMAEDTMKIQRVLRGNPRRVEKKDIEKIFKDVL